MTSIRNGICAVATLTLLLVPGAAPPSPQDAKPVQFTDGVAVSDFLQAWTRETGRKFVWRDGAGVRERRLTITGALQHTAADADFEYESLLSSVGLALSAAGPADSKLFLVEDVERPAGLKARAHFVPTDQLASLVRQPAQVFMTSIPLTKVSVENVRNAVSQILTNRNVEFTMDVPGANAMIVIGFGPTLAAIGELMASVDVTRVAAPKPPEPEKK